MDILIMLDGAALDALIEQIAYADRTDAHRVRIAVDEGELKVKVNENVWSLPLGAVKTGDDAR